MVKIGVIAYNRRRHLELGRHVILALNRGICVGMNPTCLALSANRPTDRWNSNNTVECMFVHTFVCVCVYVTAICVLLLGGLIVSC